MQLLFSPILSLCLWNGLVNQSGICLARWNFNISLRKDLDSTKFQYTIVLRLLRILRSIRILKLSRYSRGLRILGLTLYRSGCESKISCHLFVFQIITTSILVKWSNMHLNHIKCFIFFIQLWQARVLTLLVLFQIVLAVTFGSFVYYMDLNEEKREIKTIPEGIWWAIITMTTVGYGDVVPVILQINKNSKNW